MDNVGIVFDDLPATIAFFLELGLELEGQTTIDGDWAARVTGLRDMRVEIAMMRTPDGHGRLEISRFLTVKDDTDARGGGGGRARSPAIAPERRADALTVQLRLCFPSAPSGARGSPTGQGVVPI